MPKNKKPNKYKKKENGKNDTGRPSVITQEVLLKLEQAFKMGCSDKIAYQHAGISMASFYKYKSENPEFAEKVRAWQINPILKAQNNVMRVINGERSLLTKKKDKETGEEVENDPRTDLSSREVLELSKWFLEHRNKEEYGSRLEITGAGGEPLQTGSGIAEMLDLRAKVEAISDKAKEEMAENDTEE